MDLALLIIAALTTLLLAGMFIDFATGQRRLVFLQNIAPAQAGPALSIVVAARNEARGIEAAVTSLLRLDYPALEIVVVNDRSTDETGAILERVAKVRLKPDTTTDPIPMRSGAAAGSGATVGPGIAAGSGVAAGPCLTVGSGVTVGSGFSRISSSPPRITIVTLTDLPDGWLGKNHALHIGAAKATGDLLLFTDADIVFEPTTLRRAVALLEDQNLDHLAVIPDIDVPGVVLRAFIAAFAVFFSMYARPWKVRDPRSAAHIGVGAFNLIRTSAYRAIGGHASIAMRPDDDIKLGKVMKRRGFRQDVAVGRDLITVEWYASVPELVDGLMKNAFAGVDYSLWKVVAASTALFLMDVWPFVALFVTGGITRILNAISVLLVVLIFWTVNRARIAYVVGFPIAALLFAYIVWRSALIAVVSGQITWRGTAYPLAQMRANRV